MPTIVDDRLTGRGPITCEHCGTIFTVDADDKPTGKRQRRYRDEQRVQQVEVVLTIPCPRCEQATAVPKGE